MFFKFRIYSQTIVSNFTVKKKLYNVNCIELSAAWCEIKRVVLIRPRSGSVTSTKLNFHVIILILKHKRSKN